MKRFHRMVNNAQATISPTSLGKCVSWLRERNVRSILTIGEESQLLQRIQRHQRLGTHTAKDVRSVFGGVEAVTYTRAPFNEKRAGGRILRRQLGE